MLPSYEKLGAFYLGREIDAATGADKPDLLLYDSRDLTTHAVCVGMTGSGKTGLCIALLEEAAIDRIPAIVIDPKGDLSNLLLTFPSLDGASFRPWVNEDAARQAVRLVKEGKADTLCIHGDTPGAPEHLRALRAALLREGVEIRRFGAP